MNKRIITAVIGIPVLLLASFFGGIWLAVLGSVLAALAVWEYGLLLGNKECHTLPFYIMEILGGLSGFFAMYLPYRYYAYFAFVIFAIIIGYGMYKKLALGNTAALLFGFIYIIGGITFLLFLRREADDLRYILFAFLSAWITDSGAYFVGLAKGKRQLAPVLSPKKTVEGAIGGLLAALVIVGVYGIIFIPENVIYVLGVTVIASCASQFGDLIESYLKRWAGVKDSGNILPGHGGILDRFDSILFIAPVVWLFLIF